MHFLLVLGCCFFLFLFLHNLGHLVPSMCNIIVFPIDLQFFFFLYYTIETQFHRITDGPD